MMILSGLNFIENTQLDLVDEILIDWSEQRPDIDCHGKEIVSRMVIFYSKYISMLEKALKPLALSPTVFSVLVTIRRKGPQAEVNIKKMIQEVLITSGAMSNLLTRLIDMGLITKRPDEEDARSMRVQLTSVGLELIDKAMEIQAACERRFVQALSREEQKQMSSLLKKMHVEVY